MIKTRYIFNTLFVCIFITSSSFANQSAVSIHTTKNHNATIPLSEYNQPLHRNLDYYGRFLGPAFIEKLRDLKRGDLVIDSGAGLAAFAIELALQKKAHVIAINAQDMLGPLQTLPEQFTSSAHAKQSSTDRCIGDYTPRMLKDLAEVLEIDSTSFSDCSSIYQDGNKIIQSLQALRSALNQPALSSYFTYMADYSQNILLSGEYQRRVEVLTDSFGAFTYSADRHTLLEQYYSALTPTGQAFITTGFLGNVYSAANHSSNVHLNTHNVDLSITAFLEICFPKIFENQVLMLGVAREKAIYSTVLMMSKDLAIKELDLQLTPVAQSDQLQYVDLGNNGLVPMVEYTSDHQCPAIEPYLPAL